MRAFVGHTEFRWFTFLAARQPLEDVNFWQPPAHGLLRGNENIVDRAAA